MHSLLRFRESNKSKTEREREILLCCLLLLLLLSDALVADKALFLSLSFSLSLSLLKTHEESTKKYSGEEERSTYLKNITHPLSLSTHKNGLPFFTYDRYSMYLLRSSELLRER